jgi:competence protein ComEC
MREPLLLPAAAVAAGIVLDRGLAFGVRESALAAAAFAILAALPAARWLRLTSAALGLAMTGCLLAAVHRPSREPYLDAAPRETVLLAGCVVEPAVFSPGGARFTLELEPGARVRVEAPAWAQLADPPRLPYGTRVEIEARVRPPRNFGNPGAFDYAGYLARRNIFWTALVPSQGAVRARPGRCGRRMTAWIYAVRAAALERIAKLYPDDAYSRAMLEATLIGESARLERVWTEDYRRSGTYHAIVISGLHVTVLATVLLFVLRFVPVAPAAALALTALAAWLYALVSGFSTPVIRAAGGLTLFLLGRLVYRRARVLNLLAALALLYLALDPQALFDASFQLSFLAVAAIGALAVPWLESSTGPLARGLRSIHTLDLDPRLEPRAAQLRVELRLVAETVELWTRLPAAWCAQALAWTARAVLFAAELALVSAAVQVGLALPMAGYFHRVSFTGLSANLLIVPLMNAVVPLGFLALATGWSWVAALTGVLLEWSRAVAAWHAALEPAWRVPEPPRWMAAAFTLALMAAAVALRRRRLRRAAIAAMAALLALIVIHPWPARLHPGQLELTAIDVGQGDSLLVVFPEGATMVIDGGGRLSYGPRRSSHLDTGEDVVSPYLWSRGIRRVDILAATHAHQDHTGGLAALLENFRPRELWTGANPPAPLLEQARRRGVRVVEQRAGPPFAFSGATVEVIAPRPDYRAAEPGNNDSLALRLAYGSRSFLLTGDMERVVEASLLAAGAVGHVDVLKVAHHGSRTSTTEAFLEAASPAIAVISAGFDNSFGHPHRDVLARLEARHTAILRTDLGGLATVRTDGRRLWFEIAQWSRAAPRPAPLALE